MDVPGCRHILFLPPPPPPPLLLSLLQVDLLQARLCRMLGRSLYIDEDTAKFYLQDAGGDMKAAMEAFGEHPRRMEHPALRQGQRWHQLSTCWWRP